MNKTQLEKMQVSKEYQDFRDRMFYGDSYTKVKQLEEKLKNFPPMLVQTTEPNLPIDDD